MDFWSEQKVCKAFPQARGLPLFFFGLDKVEEFESRHGPLRSLAADRWQIGKQVRNEQAWVREQTVS